MFLRSCLSIHQIDKDLLRWAAIVWFVFLCAQTVYCPVYHEFVTELPWTVGQSLAWAFGRWWPWVVLTPFMCHALSVWHRHSAIDDLPMQARFYAGLFCLTFFCVMFYRVAMGYIAGESIGSSFAYHLPLNVMGFVAVVMGWHFWSLYQRVVHSQGVLQKLAQTVQCDEEKALSLDDTVRVNQGASEKLVKVQDIHYLKAAGNYVDIYTESGEYLLRSTMKSLESRLPASTFLRVHRSYFVNINAIESIRVQANSQRIVELRCGETVSVSKGYWQKMQPLIPSFVPN